MNKPKRGRPFADNPKAVPISFRLDRATAEWLAEYAKTLNLTPGQAVAAVISDKARGDK